MQLERVLIELPAGFDLLSAEGYRHIERLADEWIAGAMRFDREGEALIAATPSLELPGIGGLTIDPSQPGALCMRRFYIRAAFRRNEIGRAIAENLLARARVSRRPLSVNAGVRSEPFWEALGFIPDLRDGHTHAILPTEE